MSVEYGIIPPLKTSLEPDWLVILLAISPPVIDSARPRLRPWLRHNWIIVASIDLSSREKIISLPIASATFSASASSISLTDSSLSPFAVILIFRPSMPLARNAIVAVPSSSRRSMLLESFSARPDSESPHVLNVFDRIIEVRPVSVLMSGRMQAVTICFISHGTPGTA